MGVILYTLALLNVTVYLCLELLVVTCIFLPARSPGPSVTKAENVARAICVT